MADDYTTEILGGNVEHFDNFLAALERARGTHGSESLAEYDAMVADLPTAKSGTMRAWMRAHHGRDVRTLQLRANGAPWMPGARTVDASRASSVSLDGSIRDYAGCRVLAASDDVLMIYAASGDQVAIYRAD